MAVDQQPILIAGPARSGTSMIANLFYRHGVWIGEAGKSKAVPIEENVGTENILIKNLLRELLRKLEHRDKEILLPSIYTDKVDSKKLKDRIEKIVPERGRWLIKTSLLLHFSDVFRKIYPEAYWVLPRRNEEDILAGVRNHPVMRKRQWDTGKLVGISHNRQSMIAGVLGIRTIMVSPDRIIQEPKAASKLVQFCGLSFDKVAYERAISRKRWRRWA